MTQHKNTADIKFFLKDTLTKFGNFSKRLDFNNKELQSAIELRNEYFEDDKSQIAKMLYIDELKEMQKIVEKTDSKDLESMLEIRLIKRKNSKYMKMIKALRKAIIETENLTKAVEREKREFVHEFSGKKILPETKDLHDLKVTFNLGGSIFAPNVFLQIAQGIIMVEKDEKIEKSVASILRPVMDLEVYVRHKSNTEKKEEILKFLLACLEKKTSMFFDAIDEAFKTRSTIMELYFVHDDGCASKIRIDKIDKYQEDFIRNMITRIKDLNEDFLQNFLIINGDIAGAYKDLLRTGSDNSKKILMKLFN